MTLNEYINRKFNSLTVLEVWRDKDKKETMCKCLCDCGNTHTTYFHKVKSGTVKTCGCNRGNRKHNLHGTRIYRIWQAMKSRCLNSKSCNYKYYGGRGVTVCDEWMRDVNAFYEWSINNGYADDLTIDRIDVNGNYHPGNCRWVTMKEQCNKNKTNIYQIDLHGEKYSLRDFVDIIGESYPKILTRLQRGKTTISELEDEYGACGIFLNEYQKKAMSTCMESCENDSYMLLNLVAEVGEFAGKIAKHIRKGEVAVADGDYLFKEGVDNATEDRYYAELKAEAGDIMWQIAGLCEMMGWDLEDVCQANLAKLASRKERGVIDGNGDNR